MVASAQKGSRKSHIVVVVYVLFEPVLRTDQALIKFSFSKVGHGREKQAIAHLMFLSLDCHYSWQV